jgi:shikimate kinase
MTPIAVLVGAPGAGKTTIGRLLARSLEVGFRDTDVDVEASLGMSVTDIFISLGEPAFRHAEKDAVAQALRDHNGVLALGGGAVLDHDTRELLKEQTVIWLEVDLTHAAQRVGLNTSRPLLLGNVRSTLMKLMEDRAPLYESIATFKISTADKPPRVIVDEILKVLNK